MEHVIGESGTIIMKYNYLTPDRVLFRINEKLQYDKIIRVDSTSGCNCSGKVNTFYMVNGSKIPTNRAMIVNK